jgi:hypothetical protein
MSLRVVLNNDLKESMDPNKYAKYQDNVKKQGEKHALSKSVKSDADVKKWKEIASESEFTDSNYLEQTQNGLINAFLFAYNNHISLKIKVQDIHIAIQMIISTFVNNNAEECRILFVNHDGQKQLSVENDTIDFNQFSQTMCNGIKNNVKDDQFIDLLKPNYSTTKPIMCTVSNLLILNTMKEYFSYEFVCCCGIPEVVLDGSQEDWLNLQNKYKEVKNLFYNFGSMELDPWFDSMDIVMSMLIEMRMMDVQGTVQATNDQKKMWERVITFVPVGSGRDTFLGGWVQILSPYSSLNKIKEIVSGLPCLDISSTVPVTNKECNRYKYQDMLEKFYGGSEWSSLQNTMFLTPGTLDLLNTKYEIEIMGGFSPHVHVSKQPDGSARNMIVETNVMYCVKGHEIYPGEQHQTNDPDEKQLQMDDPDKKQLQMDDPSTIKEDNVLEKWLSGIELSSDDNDYFIEIK